MTFDTKDAREKRRKKDTSGLAFFCFSRHFKKETTSLLCYFITNVLLLLLLLLRTTTTTTTEKDARRPCGGEEEEEGGGALARIKRTEEENAEPVRGPRHRRVRPHDSILGSDERRVLPNAATPRLASEQTGNLPG